MYWFSSLLCVPHLQENLQILKDLAQLQIQRRLVDGFQETRRKILVLKANNKNNWIAYAIGNHLCGNYAKCLSILDSYASTQGAEVRLSAPRLPAAPCPGSG